jgi:hypothetical protein
MTPFRSRGHRPAVGAAERDLAVGKTGGASTADMRAPPAAPALWLAKSGGRAR